MQRRNFSARPKARPESIITTTGAKYRLTVLTDGIVRFEWAPDGVFEDRASTFAINRDLPTPKFRVVDHDDQGLEIITNRFHLYYDKKPFSASGLTAQVLGKITNYRSLWRFGEAVTDLGGTARTLDEADGRIPLGPGILSRSGFAVVDDSASMLFTDDGWVGSRREGHYVDGYLFAYGHDYRASIQAFYSISGSQPLLPRWALGNWWSRYYAYRADEYIALMDQFEGQGVPLSVAVLDMDWHLVDDERVRNAGSSGWTGYTWNRDLFPQPSAFCSEIHRRKLRLTLNDHPADGVHSYEDSYKEMAEALNLDTSNNDRIPFDITNPAFCDAYFDILHRRIEDEGCDFWWIDWQQGRYSRVPGVDPLWMLNHFHFLDNARDGRRPLTFSRYAGPGSHRYPIGFSGDTIVTWASLDFQPEFTNTASNIGYGWWSHDIGGHMFGKRNDELSTRWVQYGVFSPIMRLHSTANIWNTKEPWKFEGEARDIQVKYLRLRHRMVPYLYTMNVRAALDNEPIVQPMYWHYPERDEAYCVPNQYFFGSELIVVPITTPRSSDTRLARVRGWLPPGTYVDIFTGTIYEGDRYLWLHRPLSEYPVLAPLGAIIPLDAAAVPENGCPIPDAIEVLIVVGADGFFEIVEDDGTSSRVQDISWNKTSIRFSQEHGLVSISPAYYRNNISKTRKWIFRFRGYSGPDSIHVSINDKEHKFSSKVVSGALTVELEDVALHSRISLLIGANPQLDSFDPVPHIYSIIQRAQVEFSLKNAIWAAVTADVPRIDRVSRLHAIDMDKDILDAVLEYLLAGVNCGVKV
ncbi:glycoside hydrolase [Lipomyces tetrasporus]|uniref:Glycoside hydrolase n=1 Tax=Lipomyces tetrasporus TaxID=54092 RepID=A0AAD7VQD9_9ASCO|nr:glycoside hydrolase [Lipomyces tetrasporus]KAJ8098003.1 glycoside hydrolase [Lipomyces tetrasporus]